MGRVLKWPVILIVVLGVVSWAQNVNEDLPSSTRPGTPVPSATSVDALSNSDDYSTAEQMIGSKIDQFRTTLGLSKLVPNSSLGQVARTHSEDMATRGFFAHVNPDGLDGQDRVERAGLIDIPCGEHLYMVTGPTRNDAEEIASEAFIGWVNSPGHLKNMVAPGYDTGGVGVFVEPRLLLDIVPVRYEIYVTHLLCKDLTEYNKLHEQYEAANAFLGQLEKRYAQPEAESKAIEEQYVDNKSTRAQLEEAYEELEAARIQLNAQVEIVNELVQQLNAATGN